MRLKAFFRRTFEAQPWLAGYVYPVKGNITPKDQLEVRFTKQDVENFEVKVQHLGPDRFPWSYDEICQLGMPPSKIPRELISACPDRRPDTEPALILDVTVIIIRGGLLLAIFLHHGATDGASIGTIICGQLCRNVVDSPSRSTADLAKSAEAESLIRSPLSLIPPKHPIGLHREYTSALRMLGQNPAPPPKAPLPSAVTSHIFFFSDSALESLKASLNILLEASPDTSIPWITTNDALQSLLWHHLTRARIPSVDNNPLPDTATLIIPVNMRRRINPPIPHTYLGGAVALAPATVPLSVLHPSRLHSTQTPDASLPGGSQEEADKAYLLPTAKVIHGVVARCDDTYLREVLALTQLQSSMREMVDLNANIAAGLDLCINSWAALPIYDESPDAGGDLGMGLGLPDFVRKPWSRDAGGCIILPRDRRQRDGREPGLEVLVQLKTEDMHRLLQDSDFMGYVGRVIDA
ncbi:hypothetical protein HC762_02040 [bacterium]|nr:hypothetical protein [bacterium]